MGKETRGEGFPYESRIVSSAISQLGTDINDELRFRVTVEFDADESGRNRTSGLATNLTFLRFFFVIDCL